MYMGQEITDSMPANMPEKLPAIALIGSSGQAAELRRMVSLCSGSSMPVMLSGPAGSAKGALAAEIHRRQSNAPGAMITQHCWAIDPQMNAQAALPAKRGDTILLKEVGDLPANMHRWIYERAIERQFRIICTSRQTAAQMARENRLPPALCKALSPLSISAPPLTKRAQDIPLLIGAHIQRLPKNRRFTLTSAAQQLLCGHAWPGNFGEMQDLIARLGKQYGGRRVTAQNLIANGRFFCAASVAENRS